MNSNRNPSRIVPDINILLSGLSSPRGLARELYLATGRFEIKFVLSDGHFDELVQVLTYPEVLQMGGGITPSAAFGFGFQLLLTSEVVRQVERLDWPSCPDPKDWYLLDLFMTAGADAIVTKDKHLLRLRDSLGLPIFTLPEAKNRGIF